MTRIAGRGAAVALLALGTWGTARATDPVPFHAFLSPDTSVADVGETFVVQFRAGDPAQHFNAYRITLRFDPTLVAFRSVAEGALMIAGAPSRFAVPQSTDSTITYNHVLLGAGMFVEGPGELSRFTFEALADGISPLDVVSDPHCTFYDGGLCVNDDATQEFPRTVTLTGAVVITGNPPVDVPERGSATGLRFRPNPARAAGELLFEIRRPGSARIVVVDVAGRLLRERRWEAAAGSDRWMWDGRDQAGSAVADGVYFVRLEDALGARGVRVVRRH